VRDGSVVMFSNQSTICQALIIYQRNIMIEMHTKT